MGLNETVSAERIHISFFGRRNVGKSSLVNAVTGQALSVVSDVEGTTTDPVKKAMEILPLGPVLITDTPGFDDEGELGLLRVKKTEEILAKTDIAVFVAEAGRELYDDEIEFIKILERKKIPYVIAYNKADICEGAAYKGNALAVSAKTGLNIESLKEMLGRLAPPENRRHIIIDFIEKGDTVILVCPIDESAPKGRIILPQQQTLREILDNGSAACVCQPSELPAVLENLKRPPKAVVTDSQAFREVSGIVPDNIILTSFSILFARYKGELDVLVEGAKALRKLKDGNRVLISEGCTHHRQCGDIGTVKLPALIEKVLKVKPCYEFTSGAEFRRSLSDYALVIHCGGCMLNEAEMKSRIGTAKEAGVPIVNYGMAIAELNGILDRSLSIFQNETHSN